MNEIATEKRVVRLTFDDGPGLATTPQLLDHLKHFGIKATFFVVGRNIVAGKGRQLLKRIAEEGHQIGNHSNSHLNMTTLTSEQIENEIWQTEALIGALDRGIKLFRPPFGFHNPTVQQVANRLGYRVILWDVCAHDWKKHYSNRRWVGITLRQIKQKQDCIVLAHDVFPATVAHFPELIEALQSVGSNEFRLVS
jgi:peptidoglycan/xylan/chitin deacetylase (PgdA/CDA1 family)